MRIIARLWNLATMRKILGHYDTGARGCETFRVAIFMRGVVMALSMIVVDFSLQSLVGVGGCHKDGVPVGTLGCIHWVEDALLYALGGGDPQ